MKGSGLVEAWITSELGRNAKNMSRMDKLKMRAIFVATRSLCAVVMAVGDAFTSFSIMPEYNHDITYLTYMGFFTQPEVT